MSSSRRSNVRRSNVTACARCRSRKQRCDQNIPACSNCERAGAECVSVDIDGTLAPRSYIKNLEDRIAQLEIQLAQQNITDGDLGSLSPSLLQDAAVTSSAGDVVSEVARRCFQTTTYSQGTIAPGGQALLLSMLADPLRAVGRSKHADKANRELLNDLQLEVQPALPTREAATRLTDTYFEHCEFFSPVISSKDEFLASLAMLYDQDLDSGTGIEESTLMSLKFWTFLIFATAVLLLNRTDSSFPVSRAEGYLQAAMAILHKNSRAICTGDEKHLGSLMLLVQYSCFASNLSLAWHFLGLATRLAIELNLHDETLAPSLDISDRPDEVDSWQRRRWLFWSLYTYERNLCVILGRPFSIPDEAIKTGYPSVPDNDTRRVHALHLIKGRRLESETHTTLNQLPPLNGAVLDLHVWRDSMRQRLIAWHTSTPFSTEGPSKLAPLDIFSGQLNNVIVLLYYPSGSFPNPSPQDTTILAHGAAESIGCYKRAFRDGHLRFYWRTIHNLFRSGVAMAYCLRASTLQFLPELDHGAMTTAINTCLSVLWAMVERYPPGKVYRDVYDHLATSVLRQADSHVGDGQSAEFDFSIDSTLAQEQNADFPQNAINTIRWGFGDVAYEAASGTQQ